MSISTKVMDQVSNITITQAMLLLSFSHSSSSLTDYSLTDGSSQKWTVLSKLSHKHAFVDPCMWRNKQTISRCELMRLSSCCSLCCCCHVCFDYCQCLVSPQPAPCLPTSSKSHLSNHSCMAIWYLCWWLCLLSQEFFFLMHSNLCLHWRGIKE